MPKNRQGSRALKKRVGEILKSEDLDSVIQSLHRLSAPRVVNPLFSFLYHTNEKIKWAAVTAMGQMVATIADGDMEAARVIMRRLMWNLNDESGGIGWGSPEAMGEIMACHETLSREYFHVLLSYAKVDGNYLEHEMLQRGVLWGIGRAAGQSPALIGSGGKWIALYLQSDDAFVRGLAAWVAGIVGASDCRSLLEALLNDVTEVCVFMGRSLVQTRVTDLAAQALRQTNRYESTS